jgi:hypothetical protein
MNGDINMIKFIKGLFNKKTTTQQQNELCSYLDQLQNKAMEGMKLV